METRMRKEQLERCWQSCWQKARRPIEGILLSEDQATTLTEQSIRNLAIDYDTFPGEAEFSAKALLETLSTTLQSVATDRRKTSDHQLHRDPQDTRYERNLNLDRLQRHHPEKGFYDREWNSLPPILKPLALSTLNRKGIKGPDAEDIFVETLAELVRERQGTHHAPILDPTVFEEIIPLHIRIVGFRAIDFYRRKGSLKNQPNTGSSLEELTQNPDHAIQFEDRSADPEKPTFERIYKQCEEALSKNEWEIIFILYVTQTSTVQDLIADDTFCAKMGIKPGVSNSTRRRLLAEIIEQALEKIRENMNF